MPEITFDHPADAKPKVIDPENAIVEVSPKRENVAIVGFAASSCLDAPFEDSSYEIWGMNQLYRHIPRADRWFELHENYHEFVVEGTDHVGWLRTCPIPVYMTKHWPEYPNSVKYPLDKMIGIYNRYFTSSIAYMIALAIEEGFKRIDLFGIDLAVGDEYFYQRPCVERLLGIAEAKGIDVGIPIASALCKGSHLYGYEKDSTAGGPVGQEDFMIRRSKLTQLRDKKITELHQLDGALAEINHLISGWELRRHNAHWEP